MDIACGSGYGTHMVAKACKKGIADEIIAVDVNAETIAYARKRYHHQLITYQVEDALDPTLPEKLGYFDTILSFETIEHLREDQLFMRSLQQLLKPGGTLVLSSPFGLGRGKPCNSPFHFHQYTKQEFYELFTDFAQVDFYFQQSVAFEKGVLSEDTKEIIPPRENIRYPIGVAVATKKGE